MFTLTYTMNGQTNSATFTSETLARTCLDLLCGDAEKGDTLELRSEDTILVKFDENGDEVTA